MLPEDCPTVILREVQRLLRGDGHKFRNLSPPVNVLSEDDNLYTGE